MHGRKLYQYALETVPKTVKECIDNSGLKLEEIDKLLIQSSQW